MNLAAFLAYSIVVTFTPGPSNIVIFSTAQNHGYRKALEFVAGATVAFGLLLSLSAALNSYLFSIIPQVQTIMAIIGTTYMLYLAWKILHMDDGGKSDQSGGFMTGFTMQFINPKVVLFTLTVIGSFVIPAFSDPLDIALFVAILTFIGFCAYSSWVVLGTLFRRYLRPYQKQANIILSLTMIYCAWSISGLQNFI
ncbi:LysE family transporter [Desulfovibrio sp. JC022]|uniref:LysE family transporter n=1 Tax=Desulfovibrio sp. JC022 TaxID=2593642 RepID=UPI0013CFEDBF|nr:LysE family transporter [Desulfovibrio sp. JC022]NDV24450.1 LysE family translocator [Desulfovibrio sp. JC022]